MNIIFACDDIDEISKKYTVLELDTIRVVAKDVEEKAYGVIEKIPMSELFQLDRLKQLHHDMMEQYKTRDWKRCEDSLTQLLGSWGTELDGFYQVMLARVQDLQQNDPGPDWSPVIEKHNS